MYTKLTEQLIKYFNPKEKEVTREKIEAVNSRIFYAVDPNGYDELYNHIIGKYETFPSVKSINVLLKENEHLRKKIEKAYAEYDKTMNWNKINLFPEPPMWDGDCCILCFSQKKASKNSCIIIEKDELGYDRDQLCACAGGNPELLLYTEWVAENKRRKADNSQFIDYNHFYKSKYEEK